MYNNLGTVGSFFVWRPDSLHDENTKETKTNQAKFWTLEPSVLVEYFSPDLSSCNSRLWQQYVIDGEHHMGLTWCAAKDGAGVGGGGSGGQWLVDLVDKVTEGGYGQSSWVRSHDEGFAAITSGGSIRKYGSLTGFSFWWTLDRTPTLNPAHTELARTHTLSLSYTHNHTHTHTHMHPHTPADKCRETQQITVFCIDTHK